MATRKTRVLLGITGSVAAVKGPELCLRLLDQGYDVKVLLTQGGANFWNKAKDYDGTSWQELQEKIKQERVVIHCE
jgi:phosphopantothenoylcysteine synthetase/decarboxylase